MARRAARTCHSGGVNVYPAEVEAGSRRSSGVEEIAVFGVPDDEWGQRVWPPTSARPIRPSSRVGSGTGGEPAKGPKEVHRLADLPRTSTGKVRRLDLPKGGPRGPVGRPTPGTSWSSAPATAPCSWPPVSPMPGAGCCCCRSPPTTAAPGSLQRSATRRRMAAAFPVPREPDLAGTLAPGLTVRVPRGRVVGGSSALNAGYSRGYPPRMPTAGRRRQRPVVLRPGAARVPPSRGDADFGDRPQHAADGPMPQSRRGSRPAGRGVHRGGGGTRLRRRAGQERGLGTGPRPTRSRRRAGSGLTRPWPTSRRAAAGRSGSAAAWTPGGRAEPAHGVVRRGAQRGRGRVGARTSVGAALRAGRRAGGRRRPRVGRRPHRPSQRLC